MSFCSFVVGCLRVRLPQSMVRVGHAKERRVGFLLVSEFFFQQFQRSRSIFLLSAFQQRVADDSFHPRETAENRKPLKVVEKALMASPAARVISIQVV